MEETVSEKVTVELDGAYLPWEKVILVSYFLKEIPYHVNAFEIDGRIYDCEEGRIPPEALAKAFSARSIAYEGPYEGYG